MNKCFYGDCRDSMRDLIAQGVKVHCVVTSPPYYGLRDYGCAGQLGLEKTPEEYIANMVEVFRLVRQLLRDDGTLWLNMGDSYASGKGTCYNPGGGEDSFHDFSKQAGAHPLDRGNISTLKKSGLKPKNLLMMPARLAIALQADGWYLRSDIIWDKKNPMPESVTDRPTTAHEHIFLLSKSPRYYYDAEAIKENSSETTHCRGIPQTPKSKLMPDGNTRYPGRCPKNKSNQSFDTAMKLRPFLRNKRSVWSVQTYSYNGAHFATFPPALITPCILAGTSTGKCCFKCGAPMKRIVKKSGGMTGKTIYKHGNDLVTGEDSVKGNSNLSDYVCKTIGWKPTCLCNNGDLVPGTVFDPFLGSGTTGQVAEKLGRRWIGCELNRKYKSLIDERNIQVGMEL